MARKSTGTVIQTDLADGGRSFAIRFRVNGQRKYETLGYDFEGWTTAWAEERLAETMADVRRGLWREPEPEPEPVPRFHEFAEEWFEAQLLEGGARGTGLTEATCGGGWRFTSSPTSLARSRTRGSTTSRSRWSTATDRPRFAKAGSVRRASTRLSPR
jgi:hypothetical protein